MTRYKLVVFKHDTNIQIWRKLCICGLDANRTRFQVTRLSSSICLNHLRWTQVTRQWRTYHVPEERACNKIIIELCTKQLLDEVWYTPTNCWIIYHFQNKKQAQVMNHYETMLSWSERVWMCTLCSDSFTRANKNRVLSKLNERKRIELINYLLQGWKTC